MLSKSQSISVRLSQEDHAYLMKIEQNGAITQSEKVRELIKMARDQVGTETFTRAYLSSSETIAPYKAISKEDPNVRSDIVDTILDMVCEVVTSIQSTEKEINFLAQLEAQLEPVAEDLITRLVPCLLENKSSKIITNTINQDRKKRITHFIENQHIYIESQKKGSK
ncbi:hypothetical protein NBRC116188_06510 [Oceaniserpentilla sp. 4NH20-0058]|uniref:hypothetical protein n=1 Tax=Oceaniserpentilla sp. 4NH20-0058 TaxID=3127660 RepID=UPI003105B76A